MIAFANGWGGTCSYISTNTYYTYTTTTYSSSNNENVIKELINKHTIHVMKQSWFNPKKITINNAYYHQCIENRTRNSLPIKIRENHENIKNN